ncbi:branched-chain amino acid ABC transporter substrate-binding protein [Mesorhizobium sp. VK25A]|uniref:Branched-chain amino acid ABC transporter substrate-binding protein n=1 Tax=Mesorhizobium vachelliae TaxID=3072309 RepID=A0ABU5A6D8_9HYPH|nr:MULTISPECIES: branched-chain amino acid ABC transporter substrate-binding protein [unclassified Mesorhizobium]MDX8533273.1 branched-chain amino acid ABC transporter substrate-binding protein [Mesorhizobium sp. VK25D]MDX8545192.1 branched-chain amino acid ABC transporter substrate-binding protein [Mesorhizobium sp. VK25A]
MTESKRICKSAFVGAVAYLALAGAAFSQSSEIRIEPGAPIVIGGYWVLSGGDAALGNDQKRGVELAIKDLNGTILNHPVRLVAEDSQCSAEGGQTAATKLASNPTVVGVIGPSCSSEATAAAPILWNAGLVSIGTSATAPSLTAPDRKADYKGFLRTVFSDADQGPADAKWIHDGLKAKTVVTIHDGSPYTQQLTAEMAKTFTGLGGKIASQEAVAPTDVDMRPLLARIATEKPDAVYVPIFVPATAQILKQAKQTPGLEKIAFIGGGGTMSPDIMDAAGEAVIGFYGAFPDVTPEAQGKDYPKLLQSYQDEYGEAPTSGFVANAYDALTLLKMALEKSAKTEADGTVVVDKKALHDALFAIKFSGMSGDISCNADGQCSAFKPGIYQYQSADRSTFAIGTNPKKIYP